ncbi:MAG TPA: hypothetical protein ENK70_05870 [Methylophaga sp.]|nr:hypothetical protein [Methylophaga sp.]
MTREEAIKLQVGKDKIFAVDSDTEMIIELTVVKIELERLARLNSSIEITGNSENIHLRTYTPAEVCTSKLAALEKLATLHQFRADQALNKKFAIMEKIAYLKKKRGTYRDK